MLDPREQDLLQMVLNQVRALEEMEAREAELVDEEALEDDLLQGLEDDLYA